MFSFDPRCGVWGCFRLFRAADCESTRALAGMWFCQLQVVSVTVMFGILRTSQRV